MQNPKTDIRQVSLELTSEPERHEATHSGQVSCVICGSPVSLEHCKLDERGDPVHDQCYFDSLSGLNHSLQK